jgi:hypothetical protein
MFFHIHSTNCVRDNCDKTDPVKWRHKVKCEGIPLICEGFSPDMQENSPCTPGCLFYHSVTIQTMARLGYLSLTPRIVGRRNINGQVTSIPFKTCSISFSLRERYDHNKCFVTTVDITCCIALTINIHQQYMHECCKEQIELIL